MTYKLVQKLIGVTQISNLAEIKIDYPILDICYVKDVGFFFIADQCLGIIYLDGKVKFPFIGKEGDCKIVLGYKSAIRFKFPSSICYSQFNNNILVVEDNGKNVRALEIDSDFYAKNAIDSPEISKMEKHFRKEYDQGSTSIAANEQGICWSFCKLNKVFYTSSSGIIHFIGSGKEGYSIANREEYHKMNSPNGLAIKDSEILVSDKNNHCIRSFNRSNKEHKIVVGHPMHGNIDPEKMVLIRDSIYFIDKKSVKCINPLILEPFDMFSSSEVVSISNGTHDRLVMLIRE